MSETSRLKDRLHMGSRKEGCESCKGTPPIMMPTAPMVDLSCFFDIMNRSKTIVQSRVKRRRAINIGTFRPAVPA